MSIRELAKDYYTQRGFDTALWGRPTGKKMLEEAAELLEAIALDTPYYKFEDCESSESLDSYFNIMHEVADVAICIDYIAQFNGFTIEQAIKAKTEKDAGRGDKVSAAVTAGAL